MCVCLCMCVCTYECICVYGWVWVCLCVCIPHISHLNLVHVCPSSPPPPLLLLSSPPPLLPSPPPPLPSPPLPPQPRTTQSCATPRVSPRHPPTRLAPVLVRTSYSPHPPQTPTCSRPSWALESLGRAHPPPTP